MTGDTVQECYLNYPMTQQYWLIKVAIIENLVLSFRPLTLLDHMWSKLHQVERSGEIATSLFLSLHQHHQRNLPLLRSPLSLHLMRSPIMTRSKTRAHTERKGDVES